MLHHVVYTPDPGRVKQGQIFYEVWRGLPEVSFELVPTEAGLLGLRYQSGKEYVWVTPSARTALKKNENVLLVAMMRHRAGSRYAVRVDEGIVLNTRRISMRRLRSPRPVLVDLLVEHVRDLNDE
ncbi:hypothetical protein GF342_00655 [Candidatus Woesearchaeota archaeon]|nr:hypothetical protein [Candidatus Woesearchaeota archaeon]